MAVNGQGGFAPVLAALSTMQSNVERSQKTQAHEYLEKFQKSVRFLGLVNISSILRYVQTATSMDDDKLNAVFVGGYHRSQAICRHDIEGQSTHPTPKYFLDIITTYSYS